MKFDFYGMTRPTSRQPARQWLIAGLTLLAFTGSAVAEPPPASTGPATAETPETPAEHAQAAGLRIYLDPDTGEITDRPSPEQVDKLSAALEKALLRTADDLPVFRLLNGGHGVHLGGRFQSATVVRRRDDGSFDLRCVESAGEAEDFLSTPAPPAQPAEPAWEEK